MGGVKGAGQDDARESPTRLSRRDVTAAPTLLLESGNCRSSREAISFRSAWAFFTVTPAFILSMAFAQWLPRWPRPLFWYKYT
jgi:hypothetical protein